MEREGTQIVGRQETACSITQTFAPVLDIDRGTRMSDAERFPKKARLLHALLEGYLRKGERDE